jgi:4-hydroxybenzoyl-CoA thioesterase
VDELSPLVFRATREIRFSDCDPAGIAYTARLIDLLNGVVEDFFPAALGISYHATIRDERTGLGYAKVDCDFRRPLMMGDAAEFAVLVTRIGGASVTLEIQGFKAGELALTGRLVIVTTDLDAHKAIPIPPAIRAALEQYKDRCA